MDGDRQPPISILLINGAIATLEDKKDKLSDARSYYCLRLPDPSG